MDQIVLIYDKYLYQDEFSEFLYIFFVSKNSQNEITPVLLIEVTFLF